ncbi:MAG: protein jag [SAR202 cluster bacterium]|nr:protein jag [SAR202 cluster bacterium]
METMEVTGKSVDEAIENALEQLGANRDQVEIDVISEGKGGILGFGAEPARIRVLMLDMPTELLPVSKLVLDNVMRNMNVSASSAVSKNNDTQSDTIEFDIEGEDSGLLIGRRGESLKALQFIVNLIVNRKTEGRVILDVEGYKERRYSSLRTLANRVAERVVDVGQSITLEPMTPNERRVIHMELSENNKVATESTGMGDQRKITIYPASDKPN